MIALVTTAWAGGFEVAEQSGVAGGTGNASTARVDASAAWFDPAALADDGGARIALGAALAAVTVEASGAAGDARSDSPLGTPPHLYASWAGSGWLAGIAVDAPFAGGVRWPADSPYRFDALESAPRFFRVAPFIGRRLGPIRVSLGAHVDTGGLTVVQATDHVVSEGLATLSLRGTAVGVDASAWGSVDRLQVGVSYKSRSKVPLRGEADFDVPDAFAATLPDQRATSELWLPDRLALGVLWDGGRWRALADGVLTTWSVHDVLTIDFEDPATPDVVQRDAWRDSLAVRAGGELDLGPLTARAGGGVETATPPTDTLGPASPDGTHLSGAVGLGSAVGEHFRVDGFAEHVAVLARTADGSEVPDASYRGSAWIGGITFGTSF
jgi:hypothetical protein